MKMKMIILPLIMLVTIPIALATITCTITKNPCLNTDVFHMSAGTNAHAEQNNESSYNYRVCCSGTTLNTSCNSPNSVGIINLSSSTNAHIEKSNETSYTYSVCLTPSSGTLSCGYSSTSCSQACLGRISSNTNNHIENCTAGNYGTNICCNHTAPTTPIVGGGARGTGGGILPDVKAHGCDGEVIEGICVPKEAEKEAETVPITLAGITLFVFITALVFIFVGRTMRAFEAGKKILLGKKKKKEGEEDGN